MSGTLNYTVLVYGIFHFFNFSIPFIPVVMFSSRRTLILLLLISFLAAASRPGLGEEECMYSRIWCYECDSWTDERCGDPFNATAHPNELPPLKQCQGCCVKIVQNKGTSRQTIRRTCTSYIQINLFMVDHVCMAESAGQGDMCFCESDACNSSPDFFASSRQYFLAVLITSGASILHTCTMTLSRIHD